LRLAFLLAAALPACAHVVSMSTGEATLKGSQLDYELRMPMYEVAHISDPEPALFANIHFYGGGDEARLVKQSCRENEGNLVCQGTYLFPTDVDHFQVKCTFAAITVPNHVHLLRAVNGTLNDQAAFDASFTNADMRFRPPTLAESVMREAGAGFWRALAGPAQILFLIALLLAARSWRDLGLLFGMFAAGQLAAALLVNPLRLGISPRFIEAAAALTIAYLAVELLLIPNAGGRWIVTGVLGLFHGVYFSMLFAAGDYRPGLFLAGAISAEAIVASLAWLGVRRLPYQRAFSSVLLAIGFGWFLLRMKS
jgi:hypothetical protein